MRWQIRPQESWARELKSLQDLHDVVLKSVDKPVIIDFYAAWCPPCKELLPKLEDAVGKTGGQVDLVKVNVDNASMSPPSRPATGEKHVASRLRWHCTISQFCTVQHQERPFQHRNSAHVVEPWETVRWLIACADFRSVLKDINIKNFPTLVAVAGGAVLDVRDGGDQDALLQVFVDRVAASMDPAAMQAEGTSSHRISYVVPDHLQGVDWPRGVGARCGVPSTGVQDGTGCSVVVAEGCTATSHIKAGRQKGAERCRASSSSAAGRDRAAEVVMPAGAGSCQVGEETEQGQSPRSGSCGR
jgi:thiol-disulfide isomerase/thioredoxin